MGVIFRILSNTIKIDSAAIMARVVDETLIDAKISLKLKTTLLNMGTNTNSKLSGTS